MCAVGRSPRAHLASYLGLHSSEMSAFESDGNDVVEVPIEDDMTAKKVAFPDFDSQRNTREEVWLTIFRAENFGYPLRAVSEAIDTS